MLAVVGVAVASAILAIHLGNLATAGRQIDTTRSELLPADAALQLTEVATRDGYDNLLQALDSANSDTRGTFFAAAADSSKAQSNAWKQYLTSRAPAMMRRGRCATTSKPHYIAPRRPRPPHHDQSHFRPVGVPGEARRSSGGERTRARRARGPRHGDARATGRDGDRVAGDIGNSRRQLLVIFVIGMALFVVLAAFLLQARDRRGARRSRRPPEAPTRRAQCRHRNAIQRGLEMQVTEHGVLGIVGQALEVVAPGQAIELLMADDDETELTRLVSTTESTAETACSVTRPADCPAVHGGQAREFRDSTALDTCPKLRGIEPNAWACCVPVGIAAESWRAARAGSRERTLPGDLTDELRLVARKTGERLGVLRVLAVAEEQARSDPLTGLPNRRTLEAQAQHLAKRGQTFVVAFADLDHFKALETPLGTMPTFMSSQVFAARVAGQRYGRATSTLTLRPRGFVVEGPSCALA